MEGSGHKINWVDWRWVSEWSVVVEWRERGVRSVWVREGGVVGCGCGWSVVVVVVWSWLGCGCVEGGCGGGRGVVVLWRIDLAKNDIKLMVLIIV
jgi:hypothetical protein